MTYMRPGRGDPARKNLPKYKRLMLLRQPEDWAEDSNYFHHKAGVYEEVGDVVIGCLWKREHQLAEHPLAVRRQVVGRMFGPKAETNYRNPLDYADIQHQDTRGERRNDVFMFYRRDDEPMSYGKRVRLRGRTDQQHGPQSDPEAGDYQNTKWVRGTLYKEGVRIVGTVTIEVTATTTLFSCDLEQLSPCWENHRIRFISGRNKNFETYVEDYDRPTQDDPPVLEMHDALPYAPSAGDRFVLMRDDHRSVKWRAPYRAATEMWEYAYQCEPIEGGRMESPLYIGVRWSDTEGRRVEPHKGSTVPNPPAEGSFWLPSHCDTLNAYPYGSQSHNWMFPNSFFDPLYRQVFWVPDLGAWDQPGGRIPGVLYKAVYGAHLYGKGTEHPRGRDEETEYVQEQGIFVGSVDDPVSNGKMYWYLAQVMLWFEFPFYCRDESDPEPGSGELRWAGFWPMSVSGGWTLGALLLTFVCIHTTPDNHVRILGKYDDEYDPAPTPLLGMASVGWGSWSPSTGWKVILSPSPTPAGYQDLHWNDENYDTANKVLPYRGPCCVASRGLWWIDPDYYDIVFDDGLYYPCGVHLL